MKTDTLREKYLEFFKSKDHTVCESDVLVPDDDSVLFTPAGMNPFKDHFLGKVDLKFTRATSSQKCLRTGDIENVGRTAYHHTFFEMLGNFSFGDYFKRETINWAWEFLTDKKWLAIDPERLTVTVYHDDDEAAGIWANDVGLEEKRIVRLGEDDNFWPAGAPGSGPDGVCGPCSEIFFHPDNGPECEIWNLVFTQFERSGDPPDNLQPLPAKNIDTGMGLERIAATLQGVSTNFHIDSLLPIVEAAGEICGVQYDADSDDGRRLRRITDHVRACSLAIHENVYPGQKRENSVIRRLLRRAVFQGHEMGMREPFLYQLVPMVVQKLSGRYPELVETESRVAEVIKEEESGFYQLLEDGIPRVEKVFDDVRKRGSKVVDGEAIAGIYQTYGVPPEIADSMADATGLEFDWDAFKESMDKHGKDSGTLADTVMGNSGPIDEIKREVKSTFFTGYDRTEDTSTVCGLVAVGESHQSLEVVIGRKQMLVTVQTPFYAESGGQVGDTGSITGPDGEFQVTDTQKNGDVFVHHGSVSRGKISVGDEVQLTVDADRRDAIERAHSATHILHYSLQQMLGEHAQQRGSKVTDDWLRFDFTNKTGVTLDELRSIESMTNEKVAAAENVTAQTVPLEEGRSAGAMMLFGEKYPDPVRMVSIGEFSKELCGGTHLKSAGQVGAFEIVSEEGVSRGTRRIIALTGQKALQNQQEITSAANEIASILNVGVSQIAEAVDGLNRKVKDLKKQMDSGKPGQPAAAGSPDVSGDEQPDNYFAIRDAVRSAAARLNIPVGELAARVRIMNDEVESLTRQIEERAGAPVVDADALINSGEIFGDTLVIAQELPGANSNMMRGLIDAVRKKEPGPVALFLAAADGSDKVVLVAGVSKSLVANGISAGDWVKTIAPVVGGGGGGKPDLAQAGGKQPENIKPALEKAVAYMKSTVGS